MTRAIVMAVAAKHDIRIGDNGHTITVDVPSKHVLCGTHLHYTDYNYASYGGPKSDIWDTVLEDIKDGVELCFWDDCEYCNNV